MKWTADLEDFLARSVPLMTDAEIAAALAFVAGESVSEAAVRIKRMRLGLLRGEPKGRRWGTRWNDRNVM